MSDDQLARLNFYELAVLPDGPNSPDRFVAFYREVPYCLAQGESREAAIADLQAMIVPYLKMMLKDGVELPLPRIYRGVSRGVTKVAMTGFGFVEAPEPKNLKTSLASPPSRADLAFAP